MNKSTDAHEIISEAMRPNQKKSYRKITPVKQWPKKSVNVSPAPKSNMVTPYRIPNGHQPYYSVRSKSKNKNNINAP